MPTPTESKDESTTVVNLPAPRPRSAVQAIVPQNWQEIATIAGAICRAGMAPKSYLDKQGNPRPDMVAVAIMHGLEVGMTPMASLQSIAVINGMPSLFGDGMLAVVRASGLLEDIKEEEDAWDKDGPVKAICRVKRKGEPTWGVMECARADAQKAGWWGKAGPWSLTPHRMMQMRARGWALRDKFADVLRGLHSAEEAQDMVDITPQGSATTAPPEPKRSDYTAGDTVTVTGTSTVIVTPEPSKKPDQPANEAAPAGSPPLSRDGASGQQEPPAAGGTPNASGQPAEPKVTDVVEQITFPEFDTAKEFLDFTSGWISEPERTAAEARQWEERFRSKIAEYGQHQFPNTKTGKSWIKDSMTDILSVYAQILAKKQETK